MVVLSTTRLAVMKTVKIVILVGVIILSIITAAILPLRVWLELYGDSIINFNHMTHFLFYLIHVSSVQTEMMQTKCENVSGNLRDEVYHRSVTVIKAQSDQQLSSYSQKQQLNN